MNAVRAPERESEGPRPPALAAQNDSGGTITKGPIPAGDVSRAGTTQRPLFRSRGDGGAAGAQRMYPWLACPGCD
ncbi:hypothetical protein MTO96_019879 [Rhipicephalus appendiculatus]